MFGILRNKHQKLPFKCLNNFFNIFIHFKWKNKTTRYSDTSAKRTLNSCENKRARLCGNQGNVLQLCSNVFTLKAALHLLHSVQTHFLNNPFLQPWPSSKDSMWMIFFIVNSIAFFIQAKIYFFFYQKLRTILRHSTC